MDIAVIGTGNIGTTIGRALARAGHAVVFGSRHPADEQVERGKGMRVAETASAVEGGDAVVIAIPGSAVEAFATEHGTRLGGKLVIDASNKMGDPVANSHRAVESHAPGARYARTFNCVGVEILQDPIFQGEPADMFVSCLDDDRAVVEGLVRDVGLQPVFVGDDAGLVDGVFRLWVALAMSQGLGRQLAFRTLRR